MPVQHQRRSFLKLPQAIFRDKPSVVQVNAASVYCFLHESRVPTRQKAGWLHRQPGGDKEPLNGGSNAPCLSHRPTFGKNKISEVPLEGFEPPTNGLGNRCSILLSYRGTAA